MSNTPDNVNRKTSMSRARPSASIIQPAGAGASPHTPTYQRSISSLYGSPSSSYRTEEEAFVLEFGARFLRAGLAGESSPRVVSSFGPNEQYRIGDYRQWLPLDLRPQRKVESVEQWGHHYQLWPLDLRDADLSLVEDKIERAVREARLKYFLADSKPKRVIAAIPSMMPRPLLSSMLTTLFMALNASIITLFSNPVLCTIAAGLRSALVIDIGWAETTVTAVCEYREIQQTQSQRAGRILSQEMARLLRARIARTLDEEPSNIGNLRACGIPNFEEAEEVLLRLGWCFDREAAHIRTSICRDSSNDSDAPKENDVQGSTIPITLQTSSGTISLEVPLEDLAEPAETTLFAGDTPLKDLDDHNQPLPLLVYRTLLALGFDIRRECMNRILVVGGVSSLPGLKRRVLEELQHLVATRGWDPVWNYGSATDARARGLQAKIRTSHEEKQSRGARSLGIRTQGPEIADPSDGSPATDEPEPDWWEQNMRRAKKKDRSDPPGSIRAVESLGAWAGASLVASLKIRGIVEIEREKFLQHGLAGASKEKEPSVAQQRQSLGPGARPAAGDRSSWTLGIWA